MRSWFSVAAVAAFGLCGCAATTTTNKVAVDYNRFFQRSRDEVLVDNILRAAAREPLQFSTMGTVTGGVRNSGSISLPLANLIGGKDPFGISPGVTVNEGVNPAVTIVPLADKDFTAGILTPVSLDTMNYFLNQGWDPELILTLTVGGVVCDTGKAKTLVLNRGQLYDYDNEGRPVGPSAYDAFRRMFSHTPALPIQQVGEPETSVVRMSAKDALALLKDGVGKDRKVQSIKPVTGGKDPGSTVDVTIVKPAEAELLGLDPSEVCSLPGLPVTIPDKKPSNSLEFAALPSGAQPSGRGEGGTGGLKAYAVLRSVESIIYFLGETQRDNWRRIACGQAVPASQTWPDYDRRWLNDPRAERKLESLTLLRIDRWCGVTPPEFRAFVETKFDDGYYYVRRSTDALPTDRTMTTLTFLDELIALETTQSTITSSAPTVTIGAQ